MAVIGTSVIDVIANTAKFETGVKRAEKQLGAFTGKAQAMAAVVTGVASSALVLFVGRQMASIDALAKQADRLNTSIDALAVYGVQADLAGVGAEQFAKALQRQVQNLGKAREGTGEAADMVKRLGLNIEQLAAMRGDAQFEALAGAISKLPTQIDRANAAAAIWGSRDGAAMLNLIQEMGPGSAELRRQLEAVGVAISRVDAAKVEAANDAIDLAKQSALGLGNTIAVAVSPFIEQLAKQWFDASVAADGFKGTVTRGMMVVSASVGAVADVLHVVHVGLKAIELAGYGAAAATNLVLRPFLNQEIVQASIDNLMRVRAEYDALVTGPRPSEGIREGFFEIIEGADAAAQAVAKVKAAAGGISGPIESLADDGAVKEAAKKEEYINGLYERNIELLTGKDQALLQYEATLTDLNELLARGSITQDEYNAAVGRAQDSFERAANGMSVFADQAARNMQSHFANFLFDPFESGVEGMVKGFGNAIHRMLAEAAAAKIFEALGITSLLSSFGSAGAATTPPAGKASGGPVSPGAMYEINERGDPEVLSSGGRDYLLMGSKGGQVSNLAGAAAAGGGTIVQIINNGAPVQVDNRESTRGLDGRMIERIVISTIERDVASGGPGIRAIQRATGARRQGRTT